MLDMKYEYPSYPTVFCQGIITKDDEILLVRRKDKPWKDLWSLPGGATRLRETVESALRRGIREETGVNTNIGRFVLLFEIIEKDEDGKVRFHIVSLIYEATFVAGELTRGTNVLHARWVPKTNLRNYELTQETASAFAKLGILKRI